MPTRQKNDELGFEVINILQTSSVYICTTFIRFWECEFLLAGAPSANPG